MKNIVPTGAEVAREAIVVLAGAALAALVMGMLPEFRDWIKKQWQG